MISTAILAVMQEGFGRLPGNMANTISEFFKSAKTDLEISILDEEIQEKDGCNTSLVQKHG